MSYPNTAYAVQQAQTGLWWTWRGDWGEFFDARVYDTGPRALAAFQQSTRVDRGDNERVDIVEIVVRVRGRWCST